jgi:hypothetical protein
MLVGLILAEALIVFLYHHYQPLCEPCSGPDPCPPCISTLQKLIRICAVLPVGAVMIMLVQDYSRRNKT